MSGALFDYAVLVYHTAHQLAASQSGPFFYLPKVIFWVFNLYRPIDKLYAVLF